MRSPWFLFSFLSVTTACGLLGLGGLVLLFSSCAILYFSFSVTSLIWSCLSRWHEPFLSSFFYLLPPLLLVLLLSLCFSGFKLLCALTFFSITSKGCCLETYTGLDLYLIYLLVFCHGSRFGILGHKKRMVSYGALCCGITLGFGFFVLLGMTSASRFYF